VRSRSEDTSVHPSRRALQAGFTLIEVLVTLLIVGGIMIAITQILEATRISRDTIHNIQETQLAGPAIMDLIERDLRGLVTYDRPPSEILRVVDRVTVGLDADSLDFVTTTDSVVPSELPYRLVRCDINEVGYRLRPSPTDDDFLELYRREGFGVDDEPFEGGAFTFLHDRVKHFDIKVFTEDGPDVDPEDGWNETGDEPGLPLRLEIQLTLELAPRIAREQLEIAPIDKRTVVYRRIVRLPQSLFDALEIAPVPVVPVLTPPGETGQPAPPSDR
jgi:prepilin-type N-terminal cleavage/methylation domain-containing protein